MPHLYMGIILTHPRPSDKETVLRRAASGTLMVAPSLAAADLFSIRCRTHLWRRRSAVRKMGTFRRAATPLQATATVGDPGLPT